ncbi:MAG TPA: hypothetical protein VFU93_06040 [Acidimicrobiales bacterium]|nr:hypothetical protein [Acidimicrobiales bacterium]
MTQRSRLIGIVLVVVLLAAACGGGDDVVPSAAGGSSTSERSPTSVDESSTTRATRPSETEPPAPGTNAGVPGELRLGGSQTVLESTVDAGGGAVAIRRGPLTGLTVEVPPASYDDTTAFTVTLTEIDGATFGRAVRPLSPLVTIDNGGAYSDEILTVRVPVRVPEGTFAMGFLYEDGALEALPLVDLGADHVTIATRHFSSFLIAGIEYALLPPDVGTGFRVQDDNWQFVNRGTYPEPSGICAGMSLTSMWYFLERKDSEGELWNRWDDDGRKDTPSFWHDDAFALRWATKVQRVVDWGSLVRKISKAIARQGYARLQYDAFRYAMYVTGEPQYVTLTDGGGGSGHAMVVYAQTPGSLWVADPNYPKDLRSIRFDDAAGEFLTYSSGTNADAIAAGEDVGYERFALAAKTALVPWPTIADLYQQMKAGIVGAGVFPPYQVGVRTQQPDGSWFSQPLTSGFLTSLPNLSLGVNPTFDAMVYVFEGTSERYASSFRANGATAWATVPLRLIGANEIGLAIMGGPTSAGPNEWVDFRRFTVHRSEAVTTTTSPPATAPPTTVPPATAPPPTAPPQTWDCTGLTGLALVECSLHNDQISERP